MHKSIESDLTFLYAKQMPNTRHQGETMFIPPLILLILCIIPLHTAETCSTPTARGIIEQQLQKMLPIAHTYFTTGQLQQFDAQVGEGGCHLRALKLYQLYKSFSESPIEQITMLNPEDQRFLTLSHILTMSKRQERHGLTIIKETIDEKILKSAFSLSSKQADSFKRVSQRDLASLSIQFAQELPVDDPDIKAALSYERPDSPTFRRPCVGCFPSMSAVVHALHKKEIPCALRIVHTCKSCPKGEHMIHCLLTLDEESMYHCTAFHDETGWHGNPDIPKTDALILIDGKSFAPAPAAASDDAHCGTLKKYLDTITHLEDYTTMLTAAAAATHQFTGELIDEPFPYEALGIKALANEHERQQKLAHHAGYSEENPSVFVTIHISCCTLQELPPIG